MAVINIYNPFSDYKKNILIQWLGYTSIVLYKHPLVGYAPEFSKIIIHTNEILYLLEDRYFEDDLGNNIFQKCIFKDNFYWFRTNLYYMFEHIK